MAQTVVVAVSGETLRYDDDAQTVSTLDPDTGEVTSVRAYTEEEAAYPGGPALGVQQDVEHDATKDRVDTIIEDLKVEKDRLQVVIDKANAQIGPADTKDVARAAKRIADAAIDLAKYVDGR